MDFVSEILTLHNVCYKATPFLRSAPSCLIFDDTIELGRVYNFNHVLFTLKNGPTDAGRQNNAESLLSFQERRTYERTNEIAIG